MTQQAIEKQINDEFNKFYSSTYPNTLPSDLIANFKKSLMLLPIAQLKVEKINEIIHKKVKDLTYTEVGIIVNRIMDLPFKELYKDLKEALEKHSLLENVVIEFNLAKREKEVELAQKKQTLYSLSGTNNKLQIVN